MSVLPKALSELTISECIDWRDEHRVSECEQYIARLREWGSLLGKRSDHASTFARETFSAEIERVQAALNSRPSIESEREQLARAHAAWCAHIAEPLPTDPQGELLRIATRNVLDRARVAAYQTFIAAAQRSAVRAHLPELGHWWVRACSESADLASKTGNLEAKYFGQFLNNDAVELAAAQGRAFDGEAIHAALFAVAATKHDSSDAAHALLDARWYIVARKVGLKDAPAPDFRRWEKVA